MENDNDMKKSETLPKCGLIMPISGIPDSAYTEAHWKNVKDILERSVRKADFEPRLVCDSDPTAVIQAKIVNNIYYDDIVVCDVSSKNPNVMFELGMRLAFDKPVVIIKDDKTNYTFDIGVIQHIVYPMTLSFHKVESFIDELTAKIKSTYQCSKDTTKSSFLKHFGEFEPQKLTSKDVNIKDIFNIMNSNIEHISMEMVRLRKQINHIENNMRGAVEEKKFILRKLEEGGKRINSLSNINNELPF